MYRLGDKEKMTDCVECGKKLGLIEGYRHPTLGKEHLVCSTCFTTVSESVEQWQKAMSSYIGFFHTETKAKENPGKIMRFLTREIHTVSDSLLPRKTHHRTT